MKRLVVLLAALAVPLLPIGLAACKRETPAPDAASGGGARGARGMRGDGGGLTYAVDLLRIDAKKLEYVVSAPGTIEAFERVQVTSRVAGVVDKVGFTDGQEVKKGDVLVVIDSERYRLAVNSSKAALEKAQAAQKDEAA